MAARRKPKQPRRNPAAATPKPAPPVETAAPTAPVQTQAAEAAAEALLADARSEAEGIIKAALEEASGTVRKANEEYARLRAEAERAGEQLHQKADDEARELLARATTEAGRLRTAAEGHAAEMQATAELAAQRTEKAAQYRADRLNEAATADTERLIQDAHDRALRIGAVATTEAQRIARAAAAESDQLLAEARLAAERLTADANRYAEARMGQAMANAAELQQQAVTDVAAARQFREEGEEFKTAAAALRAAAEQRLADASTRTAKKLHRKELKDQARRERQERRGPKSGAVQLTAIHRFLIGLIVLGAAAIAAIGFTGSYGAVRDLAVEKGFGGFADVLPIGIDAGIGVLLALDLLLTWLRMSMPMLRHAAWILTGATVWFNAAASWPDPLGVGLHMAMPVLFVIVVEAARHAIGRIADIEAKAHTETPKLIRWALAFRSTWRLWRRQQVWTVRDLNVAIADEGERLVYIRSLQSKYKVRFARNRKGLGWRQQATEAELRPLDLYDTGVPFADALRRAQKTATGDAMAPAARHPEKRHSKQAGPATKAPQEAVSGRPESASASATADATGAPQTPAPERPRGATKKTSRKRSSGATRAEAKVALRALYDTLGRRPLEGELTAELKRIGSEFDSRQYANKLRSEIEEKESRLAALGSENVRPLTG
ncbi:DUF2637 domain-containing protein [Streptomyces sp. NPDC058268]|uniref:DUF2637 domain-containing protein n=1 Tax=Streptomyces sp. NPDC058268 TaxID=3346413 RepID=UPI0036E78D52